MEFLKQYWWCFVILAVIIAVVVVGLCIGIKTRREKNEVAETEENKVENQEKVEEIKDENTESIKEEKTPKTKKQVAKKQVKEEKTKKEEPKEEENKKEVKEEIKEEPKEKHTKQRYIVTYDKEAKQWVVKKTDSQRASRRCKTKAEALEIAERLSESQELSLTVKKKDGKFQKQR